MLDVGQVPDARLTAVPCGGEEGTVGAERHVVQAVVKHGEVGDLARSRAGRPEHDPTRLGADRESRSVRAHPDGVDDLVGRDEPGHGVVARGAEQRRARLDGVPGELRGDRDLPGQRGVGGSERAGGDRELAGDGEVAIVHDGPILREQDSGEAGGAQREHGKAGRQHAQALGASAPAGRAAGPGRLALVEELRLHRREADRLPRAAGPGERGVEGCTAVEQAGVAICVVPLLDDLGESAVGAQPLAVRVDPRSQPRPGGEQGLVRDLELTTVGGEQACLDVGGHHSRLGR